MRRTPFLMLAASFALACADIPSSPLLEPQVASLDRTPTPDYPPPPFALVEGDVNGTTYEANFFVNKPGNVAWLMFTGGTGVTFSNNARIMSVNGNVSGFGTMTIGTTTYQLNTVDESSEFSFDGNCTANRAASCASFSGDGFRSTQSSWTGQLAGGRDFGKGGFPGDGDGDGGEVICCDVIIADPIKKGR